MLLKDIQQNKDFRNEHQKVMVNIQFTSNWLLERIKNYLELAGITPQQYNILRILRGSNEPLSTMQIRERMLDKMSDTSRLVDRLILKGLVDKTIRASDKRLVDVFITEKGLDCLQELDEKTEQLDNIAFGITEDEAKVLNALLDKLRHPYLNIVA
jgi:DNA-binding MarR family transcriptional regulator